MLSDDFENFAGKTQTFQVKQNPSDQQFPVRACSFCFFSFVIVSIAREVQNDSDIPFMQKTDKVQYISVLKLCLFS